MIAKIEKFLIKHSLRISSHPEKSRELSDFPSQKGMQDIEDRHIHFPVPLGWEVKSVP